MTDQEINIAIAKVCGWTFALSKDWPDGMAFKERNAVRLPVWTNDIPNYCGDLNAMHEAEEKVPITNYYENLCACNTDRVLIGYRHLWHATARQRAEAFLRTLGKWKE